jgi:hypothetical protein
MLLRTRTAFLHLAYLPLQCWRTGRTPAALLFFFRFAPAPGVSFTAFQQLDQANDSDGPVLAL